MLSQLYLHKTKSSDTKENRTATNSPLKVGKPNSCEMRSDINGLDFPGAA